MGLRGANNTCIRGLVDDKITDGGADVRKLGYGHEIFNFQPHEGYKYGYVQVKGAIAIERLGASKDDDYVDGVLAVWVAREPRGGTFIVGWYDNATVYRNCQPPPPDSKREYQGDEFGYMVKAEEKNCTLLPKDARVFKIPRNTKGGMGQSNVWYANVSFKQQVWNYITQGRPSTNKRPPRQPDPYKRQQVERKAIEQTKAHYTELGYSVDTVEKDNIGWDLVAKLGDRLLRLEVKGLSQKELLIELTPNEYAKMQEYQDSYRICVVTDALGKEPVLRVFSFTPESQKWEDDEGNQLTITEITSAKMSIA